MKRRQWRRGCLALLAAVLCAPSGLAAQQTQRTTVTGTVLSAENRQPLAGAQVSLRGTALGSLTDARGRFSIAATVPAGTYPLVVDYLGRRQETRRVTVGQAPTVDVGEILLEASAVALQEVVVTAPGVSAQRLALGNEVATVSSAQLSRVPAAIGVGEALQGKITGATITQSTGQPGGGITIRLRGSNSILGSAEPLIVLDGTILDDNTEALTSLNANANRGGAAISSRLSDI
ncbi:MAG TPA: carboxypeptidase-like regulatory domain-containing protein, partial [Longimicrobiales bacterium]